MRRAVARYCRDLFVNGLVASPVLPVPARWRALKMLGVDVGRCYVKPGLSLGSLSNVHVGEGTRIGYDVRVDGPGILRIGSRCGISARVMFITSSHEIAGAANRSGALTSAPTTVGDGSWIGAGAIILPGVTVGNGCVIGAGAVVTGDCEPNSVYAGVPARLVRSLA